MVIEDSNLIRIYGVGVRKKNANFVHSIWEKKCKLRTSKMFHVTAYGYKVNQTDTSFLGKNKIALLTSQKMTNNENNKF